MDFPGKYEPIREIGRGRSGRVFLARHKTLGELRAVKRVPHLPGGFPEAAILSRLSHEGIPRVYDTEEDSSYMYLIEEYLEGRTLRDFVEERGIPDGETLLDLGIALCDIFIYLHSLKPDPVLYLDLRPDNLMVAADGRLKLVDFDCAVEKSRAGKLRRFYGTPFFSAPELFSGEIPDERADIYSVGAVLWFMASGGETKPPGEDGWSGLLGGVWEEGCRRELRRIIGGCLSEDRRLRPGSAEEIGRMLRDIRLAESGGDTVRVAVCADRPGRGATFLAFLVADYLARRGVETLYREENDSGDIRRMANARGLAPDRSGTYAFRDFRARPFYGPGVSLERYPAGAEVLDLGADYTGAARGGCDLILLILGKAEWEREDIVRALECLSGETEVKLLIRDLLRGEQVVLPDREKLPPVYRLPLFPGGPDAAGAFLSGEERARADRFFAELLSGTRAERKLAERSREDPPEKKKRGWEFFHGFRRGGRKRGKTR